MLRVTSLGSGSQGNSLLVEGTEGSVLVDAGFSPRRLARRFALVNRRPDLVGALLLTHEHSDHVSGAHAASTRWKWPVLAVDKTFEALDDASMGQPREPVTMMFDRTMSVCGLDVLPVPVPHDSRTCAALVITDRKSGARLGIAMDLGHVPAHLPSALAHCDLLVVESNHDERMLVNGPYPWQLKQRVGGMLGHLSNGAAASVLASVAHRGLRGVMLAHLSQTNNTPTLALQRTRAALRRAGWRSDSLWAATQSVPCGPIGADGSRHAVAPAATQLTLEF
jgi:phosphoribosyl 1,2-cyclic phosphodiesterase